MALSASEDLPLFLTLLMLLTAASEGLDSQHPMALPGQLLATLRPRYEVAEPMEQPGPSLRCWDGGG